MVTPISTRKLCFDILKINKQELLALLVDADSYYKPFENVTERDDGTKKIRVIEPSYGYLKQVQRRIDKEVLKPAIESLPIEIMGGRKGFSVVRNAKHHKESKAVMKYDVKQFFPSIKYDHVYQVFRYKLNYCEEAANMLTHLITYNRKDLHVPQGAPTSTSIAILSLEKMCLRLKEYSDNNGLKFSIWVDDITVSGDSKSLKNSRYDINRIVNSTPFTIHPDKDTGILKKGSKEGLRITGIVIDQSGRLTLGRKKLRQLKKQASGAKVHSDRLAGKLLFLRQVNKKQGGKLYHNYKKQVIKKH
jgi:RNA-directed DNA polymerase